MARVPLRGSYVFTGPKLRTRPRVTPRNPVEGAHARAEGC
jgi:hypothetical protein